MDHDEPVPEAEATDPADTAPAVELSGEIPSLGDKPEADALEQALPVGEQRVRVVAPPRDDVPEADWLEQSVVEPLDDEEPR